MTEIQHNAAVKPRIILLFSIFVQLTVIFVIAKCAFVLVNAATYSGLCLGEFLAVIWHGLPMDFSMAGYLTVIPSLILLGSSFAVSDRIVQIIRCVLRIVLIITALICALAVTADAMLYPYWGFKLDTTPLFYFLSSPGSAMASGGVFGASVMLVVLALLFSALLLLWVRLVPIDVISTGMKRIKCALILFVLTAALFLPIRGGLTVSTMNLSRSYFSADTRMNHAAVNPLFSFLYSASHQNDFDSQFHYYSEDEANGILRELSQKSLGDTIAPPRLSTSRPDIYLVILESFSAHLLPSLGGAPVAMRLDSIARQGWLFTQCYASSFRTDRALPAVLSGYPGQPTTSIMKFVEKTDRLPSLPASLKEAGYDLSYYYGGDINFTSMNAYLVSSGFDHIVSDVDFPVTQRMSKWGAPDHLVFNRALADLDGNADSVPRFTVIQTSSSHEPFDVPFRSDYSDPRLNAFAYADHSLGEWIDSLSRTSRWNRSLVVIVPDHFAVWPDTLMSQAERHHVPLVITGGAVMSPPEPIDDIVAQTDIAATILGLLGISYNGIPFSHDIFDPQRPEMAFFSEAEHASIVTPDGVATINVTSDADEEGDSLSLKAVRAYLQILYTDLQQR